MKNISYLLLLALPLFISCSKDSDSVEDDSYGTKLNTWTFTAEGKEHKGLFLFESASLNTTASNNTYFFGMLGVELETNYLFNINLSLTDLNFTNKSYQSGVDQPETSAFYFTQPNSLNDIYKSSNLDPGPVMNYTITSYNASKDIVTLSFSGKAFTTTSGMTDITNGKVTVQVER